jgi:hypothetical protein
VTCTFPDQRHKDGLCGRPAAAEYIDWLKRPAEHAPRCEKHDTEYVRTWARAHSWMRRETTV